MNVLIIMLNREIELRSSVENGNIKGCDVVKLCTCAKYVYDRFGGQLLSRSFRSRSISPMDSYIARMILCLSDNQSELSKNISSKIALGLGEVNPRCVLYMEPSDILECCLNNPTSMKTILTFEALQHVWGGRCSETYVETMYQILVKADLLEKATLKDLVCCGGNLILTRDITSVITSSNMYDYISLLERDVLPYITTNMEMRGLDDIDVVMYLSNLRLVAPLLNISYLFDVASQLTCILIIGYISHSMSYQPFPSYQIMELIPDLTKLTLLENKVWSLAGFHDTDSLRFKSTLSIVKSMKFSATQIIIPRRWWVSYGEELIRECSMSDVISILDELKRTFLVQGFVSTALLLECFGNSAFMLMSSFPTYWKPDMALNSLWVCIESRLTNESTALICFQRIVSSCGYFTFSYEEVMDCLLQRKLCSSSSEWEPFWRIRSSDLNKVTIANIERMSPVFHDRALFIDNLMSRGYSFSWADICRASGSKVVWLINETRVSTYQDLMSICTIVHRSYILSILKRVNLRSMKFPAEDRSRLLERCSSKHHDEVTRMLCALK